jgi:hypothetical protein
MGRALSSHLSASVALAASPVLLEKVNATDAALSPGVFPADLHGMRRRLPNEWAGFLRQHFNSDVRTIRAFFDCDERTARDWLAGRHGVNGAPLLKLIRQVPAARVFFLGEAA